MRSNLQVMNPCPQAHCGGSLIPSRTAPGRMACVLCSRTDGMRLEYPAGLKDVAAGRSYVSARRQRHIGERLEAA